jgi:cell division protein FtsB
MLDRDDLDDRPYCSNVHEHWLTMQSAYMEYSRATQALECTFPSADDSSGYERERLEDRRRLAFERYLETRMEFLESRFDECYPPGTRLPEQVQSATRPAWMALPAVARQAAPALCGLLLVLLCVSAYSFVRTRNHVHELEASRDDLRARLNQTSNSLQTLAQKLNTLESPSRPVIQQVEAPAHPYRAVARKRTGVAQSKRRRVQHLPAKNVVVTQTHLRRRG